MNGDSLNLITLIALVRDYYRMNLIRRFFKVCDRKG